MKLLSERLEHRAMTRDAEASIAFRAGNSTNTILSDVGLLREAAAALRAVEGSATAKLSECCGHVTVGDTWGDDYDAVFAPMIGKRVALVPLDAAGSAEGVEGG